MKQNSHLEKGSSIKKTLNSKHEVRKELTFLIISQGKMISSMPNYMIKDYSIYDLKEILCDFSKLFSLLYFK